MTPARDYVDMSIYWMLKQMADVVMKPTRDYVDM
jgi:3-methyladenine DNA glycosylase AlkD